MLSAWIYLYADRSLTFMLAAANFFYAPYHLHCYREPPKAGLADSSGLVSLSFFLVDLPDRLICFNYQNFYHIPQRGIISIAPGNARGSDADKFPGAAPTADRYMDTGFAAQYLVIIFSSFFCLNKRCKKSRLRLLPDNAAFITLKNLRPHGL